MKPPRPRFTLLLCSSLLTLAVGCSRTPSNRVQGYIEGEFIYVAAPAAGSLERLAVQRGTQVKPGDLLFTLEHAAETAAQAQATHRLAQSRARLADAQKGKRPSEQESIEAQIRTARVALDLAEVEFARQETLMRSRGVTTQQELDRARSARDQQRHRLEQLEAELETARLGLRPDQIAAAEADVAAQQAVLARADWDLAQKQQTAPQAGAVFDTLYREGEWVPAGRPVVALLPPAQIKLRTFVPQPWLNSVHVGDSVQVLVDGHPEPFAAKISFISPRAEYTPPVIYSRENRNKLVFMVEAEFPPDIAARLHPGQPVDAQFNLSGGHE